MDKRKNNMESEPVSLSTAQTTINPTIQKVDKLVQRWLMSFDSWTDYLTSVHFLTIHKERSLKFVFKLEDKILNWAKTEVISESLTRREFMGMQLRESLRRFIIIKNMENFESLNRTSIDDSSSFNN